MTVSEPTEAPADPSGDPRHRLHPLTPLYNLLSWLRRFWFVLIPIILGDGDPFTLALAAFSALAGASSVVQWFYSYYSLHTDALEFRTGLISRTQHTMPYERMQQVSIERRLRHRLFGVAALTVKTAGGGGAVSLDTLSIAEAERLRALLDLARARTSDHGDVTHAKSSTGAYPTDESSTDVAGEVVLRLSIPELALAGVTGQTVVFVLAVV
ncbi:MAG: PH domain-containing protein, partial [Acidimicrobiales bacterium]